MRCRECGEEHELLEPAFRRPDQIVALSAQDRPARVDEDDDMCRLRVEPASVWRRLLGRWKYRYFLRAVLPVVLVDASDFTQWGLWVEVTEEQIYRVRRRWSDPNQSQEPSFVGAVANKVPDYPDTIGLAVRVQLREPPLRAALTFEASVDHPFAVECRAGVSTHRVIEWLRSMGVVG